MRGYTVTTLRDAAPHKDWFTELMGTCAQHMAMLERSESHSAAGAHGDLAAKKPPHIAHTCTHTPWSCWGILKLRTTTLAPRYIFESATKCVRVVGMWWWGISAGVPLCENVREHPESQKSWLEQLAEMKHSSRKYIFCKWPAGFYRFCVLSPPLPHPSGPSPIGRAKLIVQKVLQSVSGNLSIYMSIYIWVCPGPDCWGCFFLLWDFPLCCGINGILKMLATRCCLDWDSSSAADWNTETATRLGCLNYHNFPSSPISPNLFLTLVKWKKINILNHGLLKFPEHISNLPLFVGLGVALESYSIIALP